MRARPGAASKRAELKSESAALGAEETWLHDLPPRPSPATHVAIPVRAGCAGKVPAGSESVGGDQSRSRGEQKLLTHIVLQRIQPHYASVVFN